jgi:phosphomevalonate kinase
VKARAPGKVVISGAYAVLRGAPAVVTAVDRYVLADTARPAEIVTPEVREAIGGRAAPWFDASALREGGQKLGLGSSAAILVASLAALEAPADDATLCSAVFERALEAHRHAQQGGSGIDVAASAHGGTLIARRCDGGLEVAHADLPPDLRWEVWATGVPASTPSLLGRVRALEARDPRALDAQCAAAERAALALMAGDAPTLISALAEQCDCLRRLGEAAGADIVTTPMQDLHALARTEGAAVLPSGAGGGDVVLFAGHAVPSAALCETVARLGYWRLHTLRLGARGVHCA